MSRRFEGRVYLVTGGALGIGKAIAEQLASGGGSIVVADVNDEAGARAVQDLEALGGRAAFAHVDATDEAQIVEAVEFAVSTYGRLDGAANNAGGSHRLARLHELEATEWDAAHAINLRSTFLCMREEIKYFLTAGGGTIVNTVSAAGRIYTPGLGAYVSAKHALVGLIKQAAIEYVDDGIRVNGIAPGLTATEGYKMQSAEDQAFYASQTVGGRASEPREQGVTAAFLLSDDASYITGEVLAVDNGLSKATSAVRPRPAPIAS